MNPKVFIASFRLITKNCITVSASSTIYLDGVNVVGNLTSGLMVKSSMLTLVLYNNKANRFTQLNKYVSAGPANNLSSAYTGKAGINVDETSTLSIMAEDDLSSLYAEGGKGYSVSDSTSHGGAGAGIGGDGGYSTGNDGGNCGNIIIYSGNIKAIGGTSNTYWGSSGAGIGGGGGGYSANGGSCGKISIYNGNVYAEGGKRVVGQASSGNGIGAGVSYSGYSTCSEINISGGTVYSIGYNAEYTNGDYHEENKYFGYGLYASKIVISGGNVKTKLIETAQESLRNTNVNPQDESGRELDFVVLKLDEFSSADGFQIENYSTSDVQPLDDNLFYFYLNNPEYIVYNNVKYYLVLNELEYFVNMSKKTITFNCGNYKGIVPDKLNTYSIPDVLPKLKQDGYTFVAWYYDSDFTEIANGGEQLLDNITLYAQWAELHVHSWSEWEYLPLSENLELKRHKYCTVCNASQTENIPVSNEINNSLEELKTTPTTETLKTAKETLVNYVVNNSHNCDGNAVKQIVGEFSGRLDEFALSEGVANNLLATYADALADVRRTKLMQKLQLSMAKEFNAYNTAGEFTKDSLTYLRAEFERINGILATSTDSEDVAMFEVEWKHAVSQLKKTNIICDGGSIGNSNGLSNSLTVSINKVTPSPDLEQYLSDKKILGTYKIDLKNGDDVVTSIDGIEFKIRIKLDGDVSKVWKIKAAYMSDKGISYHDATIVDGYAVFKAQNLTDFSITYQMAYPIYPFIILACAIFALGGVLIFLNVKNKKAKEDDVWKK